MTTENNETTSIEISDYEMKIVYDSEKASEFVYKNPLSASVDLIVRLQRELTACNEASAKLLTERDDYKKRYLDLHTTNRNAEEHLAEWIRSRIARQSGATLQDLKDLAEYFEIELTKKVTVTFQVDFSYTYEVDLDFDEDEIDEMDFDASINVSGALRNEDEVDREINFSDFEITNDME